MENLGLGIYEFSIKKLEGGEVGISEYKNNVLLIVNVASRCGFTPQYEQLEKLHLKFDGKELSILAFPCNDFADQEPGSEREIREFCDHRYGVTFDMYGKVKIRGGDAHPLYNYLEGLLFPVVRPKGLKAKLFQVFTLLVFWLKERRSPHVGEVEWNFHKFIIGKNGHLVGHFSSDCDPFDPQLMACIEGELRE